MHVSKKKRKAKKLSCKVPKRIRKFFLPVKVVKSLYKYRKRVGQAIYSVMYLVTRTGEH